MYKLAAMWIALIGGSAAVSIGTHAVFRAEPAHAQVLPDQNTDWIESLLHAAIQLGVQVTPECEQSLRDHVLVRGFQRGAVLRDGRFILRDIYGEDRWFC